MKVEMGKWRVFNAPRPVLGFGEGGCLWPSITLPFLQPPRPSSQAQALSAQCESDFYLCVCVSV